MHIICKPLFTLHALPDCARKQKNQHAAFPFLPCCEIRMQKLSTNCRKRREVVFENQIVWVSHASEGNKKHPGLRARVFQTDDDLVQRHTLCLPWYDGPSQAQGKLFSLDVLAFAAFFLCRLEDNPRPARGLGEEWWTSVAGEIDDDSTRHSIFNAIMVWVVTR